MADIENRKIKSFRIQSMRKPRRVLLSLGTCGCIAGIYLIMKFLAGADRKFIIIGLVYILLSFFLIGLGEALAGISRVRRNAARKRKSGQ